ncbi:MAG: DUF4411 family protein [Pseudorhodoplanes sp.]|nr:DUF4411 family protein [Pseudorhodoplanes sp.]
MAYCIDTSCIIAAWEERYPLENFPKFWLLFEQAIADGKILAPEPVLDETEPKSAELYSWLKEHDGMFLPLEDAIQLQAKAVLAKHPRLVAAKKQRTSADPFVIATATVRRLMIVTEERPTGNLNRPNIPDVCGDFGVTYMSLLQMIRAEKWVIG